jgi:hypothetical protein
MYLVSGAYCVDGILYVMEMKYLVISYSGVYTIYYILCTIYYLHLHHIVYVVSTMPRGKRDG